MIKTPSHVIPTVNQCHSLLFFEHKQPERMKYVCYVNEKQVMEKYVVNANAKVTPLKLPPCESPEEIAFQWEFKLED